MKPDVVIDMINFRLDSARQIVEALRGEISHYLYTSSVWGHGMSTVLARGENHPGIRMQKYGIQNPPRRFFCRKHS
jgi:phage-related protein